MRIIFRAILGFFLLSSSVAQASEVKPFIGIDLSQASTSVKNTFSVTGGSFDYGSTTVSAGTSVSASEDLNVNAFGFKVGAILESGDRIYLKKATFSKNDGDLDLTTIHYDYMFHNKDSMQFYVGGHIGQAKFDQYGQFNASSTPYGFQLGLLAPIQEGFVFDASIVYTALNISGSESVSGLSGTYGDITFNNTSLKVEQDIDTATTFNVGLNYNF